MDKFQCPIFKNSIPGFCLKDTCRYFAYVKNYCGYEKTKAIEAAALKGDREKLGQALIVFYEEGMF
jgi:hypothetical protein